MRCAPAARSHKTRAAFALAPLILLVVSATQVAWGAGPWEWLALRQGPGELVLPRYLAAAPGGVLYVVDSTCSQIHRRDAQGHWDIMATLGSGVGEVNDPSGLAVAGDGTLFVADQGNHRLQLRSPDGRWLLLDSPPLAGRTLLPRALAARANGALYLIEGGDANMRLWVKEPGGAWQDPGITWSEALGHPKPSQIAVDPQGGLYVLEAPRSTPWVGKLRYRTPAGEWNDVAPEGEAPGSLSAVGGFAFTLSGELVVEDSLEGGYRVQVRDKQGVWTTLPPPDRFLANMVNLAADGEGHYFFTKADGSPVLSLGLGGQWEEVTSLGQAPGQVADGTRYDVDPEGGVYMSQALGGGSAINPDGTVLVFGRDRIDARSPGGKWQRLADCGAGIGEVFQPIGMAVAPTGDLITAEGYPLSRLQRRSVSGQWERLDAYLTDEAESQMGPSAMVFDAAGTLWLGEAGWYAGEWLVRVRARSPVGQWTTFVEAKPSSAMSLGLLPDGQGGLYLWRVGSSLVPTDWTWVRHYHGPGFDEMPALGSVSRMCSGPEGEIYLIARERDGLWQVGPRGQRVKLAAPGLGLGQVSPSAYLLKTDRHGRLYLCSSEGVQRYTPPTALLRGDTDGDGQFSIADVVLALRFAVGLTAPTPTQELRADVWPATEGDGKVTISDVVRLLRRLLSLESVL